MINDQPLRGVFVTGTDTGVGKTYVSSRLIRVLRHHGIRITPRKPVESGCRKTSTGTLLPDDGHRLCEAAGVHELEAVTPFRFEAALAPPSAAALEGKQIQLSELVAACKPAPGPLIVEGAGGFLSPIANDGLNADLALNLKLPVLIVTSNRLGCINHCLLTCEAVERRGLDIIAIVLNQADKPGHDQRMDNADELSRLLTYPVFEIPYQGDDQDIESLAVLTLDHGLFGNIEK